MWPSETEVSILSYADVLTIEIPILADHRMTTTTNGDHDSPEMAYNLRAVKPEHPINETSHQHTDVRNPPPIAA